MVKRSTIERIGAYLDSRNSNRLIELQTEKQRLLTRWRVMLDEHADKCALANSIEPWRAYMFRMAREAVINQKAV